MVVYPLRKRTTAAFDFANYDENLDLGRLRKPDFPETVGCRFSLRNLCGGPRYRSDVDDEYARSVAIFDFAVVDSGFVAFLSFSRKIFALSCILLPGIKTNECLAT